jgi:bifunctional UDP-N-acetylglucosamine pyrophosphorylase/glucosamine-1-phosphate N-acetyltransferase
VRHNGTVTDRHLAIVVLAAGQGTRMRSRTPKLLHNLAGKPIVAHVLVAVRELDAAHVVSVVRHERDLLAEAIHAELPASVIVDQDDVPGTGRAVERAVEALPAEFEGDVLVINGDAPLLDAETLTSIVVAHRAGSAAATVLSATLNDAAGYGRIVRAASGALDGIVEEKDATPEQRAVTEVNAGVYVFGASDLRRHLRNIVTDNVQGEKYLTDVIGLLRAAGSEVQALAVNHAWKIEGINDRVQLSAAASMLNSIIVRDWQRAGVTVTDPATTWIDVTATLSPDVTLLPGTRILGATEVETGATIGPFTTLVDCEVGERATIRSTEATLAVIGADATVGPFSYLRPGTVLGADGKIGAFVETKNAVIGASSKVPHLSYVGDATVGDHSNIGAGTIFANYDGQNKNTTRIGSHVRGGSHTVFVAPISIGDGAYTGAGTVVRKDVPPGSLAVTVAPQRNVDGWVKSNRPGSDAANAASAAREDEGFEPEPDMIGE